MLILSGKDPNKVLDELDNPDAADSGKPELQNLAHDLNQAYSHELTKASTLLPNLPDLEQYTKRSTSSFFNQFIMLIGREWKNMKRNPKSLRTKVGRTIINIVLIMIAYFRLGTDHKSI
jgi:hypothetical protein